MNGNKKVSAVFVMGVLLVSACGAENAARDDLPDATAVLDVKNTDDAEEVVQQLPTSTPFDASPITVTSPEEGNFPSHTVTLAAPDWPVVDSKDGSLVQYVHKYADDGELTFVKATIWWASNSQGAVETQATAPSGNWTLVSDEAGRTLGDRTLRVLISESEVSEDNFARDATILTVLDEEHYLLLETRVWPGSDADFDEILNAALDSLTITS